MPAPDSEAAHTHWRTWHQDAVALVAPSYWPIEIASALRRLEWNGDLTGAEADRAFERALELGVELFPLDLELGRSALRWARRLDQAKAYDGFYLALAEAADAELWTADLRLARGARQAGVAWVRGLRE